MLIVDIDRRPGRVCWTYGTRRTTSSLRGTEHDCRLTDSPDLLHQQPRNLHLPHRLRVQHHFTTTTTTVSPQACNPSSTTGRSKGTTAQDRTVFGHPRRPQLHSGGKLQLHQEHLLPSLHYARRTRQHSISSRAQRQLQLRLHRRAGGEHVRCH